MSPLKCISISINSSNHKISDNIRNFKRFVNHQKETVTTGARIPSNVDFQIWQRDFRELEKKLRVYFRIFGIEKA